MILKIIELLIIIGGAGPAEEMKGDCYVLSKLRGTLRQ